MKRLIKIGVLLLFMIGMFTVQTGYSTPVLVDDDVGVEFTTNVDVSDDTIIAINFVMPDQVATPLKYQVFDENYVTTLSIDTDQGICFEALNKTSMVTQDDRYTPEIMLTNSIMKTRNEIPIQFITVMGLTRLEIGECS